MTRVARTLQTIVTYLTTCAHADDDTGAGPQALKLPVGLKLQVQIPTLHSQPRANPIKAEERCATNESDDTRQVRHMRGRRKTNREDSSKHRGESSDAGNAKRGVTQRDKSMTRR
jgi:hypothetical protein